MQTRYIIFYQSMSYKTILFPSKLYFVKSVYICFIINLTSISYITRLAFPGFPIPSYYIRDFLAETLA